LVGADVDEVLELHVRRHKRGRLEGLDRTVRARQLLVERKSFAVNREDAAHILHVDELEKAIHGAFWKHIAADSRRAFDEQQTDANKLEADKLEEAVQAAFSAPERTLSE
jgi:hypothetical protein